MTQAWQVLLRRVLLERAPWISVWVDRVRLPNGTVIEDYFGLDLPSWVAVFAVTGNERDAQVPMVWQYRHGIGQHTLELPAGYIDNGESPLEAARRELREEVGCTAESFEVLGSYAMLPERSPMMVHVILARRTRRVGAPQPEATEELAVRWLTLAEVRDAWRKGQIIGAAQNAAIARALDVLGRCEDQV